MDSRCGKQDIDLQVEEPYIISALADTPFQYFLQQQCMWIVTAPSSSTLFVKFLYLSEEFGTEISSNQVVAFGHGTDALLLSSMIMRITEYQPLPPAMTIDYNELWFRYGSSYQWSTEMHLFDIELLALFFYTGKYITASGLVLIPPTFWRGGS